MKGKLQRISVLLAGLMFALAGWAQTSTTTTSSTTTKTTTHRARKSAAAAPSLAQQIKSLQSELQAERQQNQQMMQEMQQRQDALQQQLQQIQSAAADAGNKAAAAQSTATDTQANVTKLQSDVAGVQSTVADVKTNTATLVSDTQDEQKKLSDLKGALDRMHFSGDVRLRGDGIFQRGNVDRDRARFRFRFGVEGNPNEDFTAGAFLATGFVANSNTGAGLVPSVANPDSANETFSNFFSRGAIGVDRAWITYHPQAAKWLNLTGGKYAPDFPRTDVFWDDDLNPEGFSEKFSFDSKNSFFKNFTVDFMQLIYNEVAGGVTGSGAKTSVNRGVDSNVIGGFVASTWQFGPWKTTPSFLLMNWNGANAIAQAVQPVGLCATPTSTNCILEPNTTPVGTPIAIPISATQPILLTNPMTNATYIVGTGTKQTRAFVSGFEYADFQWNNVVNTPWKRFPWNWGAEYEQNLRAKLDIGFAPSKQDKAYAFSTSFGQQKNKHDLQIGYYWWRSEQDAVISAFAEDDQHAGSNNLQNRLQLNWMATRNVQIQIKDWIGRTLNAKLQNALLSPINPKGTSQDPYMNRLQVDLLYKF